MKYKKSKFNNNKDLRDFAIALCTQLERNGEYDLANALKSWSENAFTSSSEFLGELMLILENASSNQQVMQPQLAECLKVIKHAITQS